MSLATELRQHLIDASLGVNEVAQTFIPETADLADGAFLYFARRATAHARTMDQATGDPDSAFFDIEIYDYDPDVVEIAADKIQLMDCQTGDFGTSGRVRGIFVETQTDDYVPRVEFTDDQHVFSSFLSVEIRGFTP